MKEMTPEQLDAYMEAIPEWKRGALVVQDQTEEEKQESESLRRRIKNKIANKVKETSFVKDLMEKEGEKIEWARKEYQAFKSDAREQIENSHNPLIRGAAQVVDKVKADT